MFVCVKGIEIQKVTQGANKKEKKSKERTKNDPLFQVEGT